jgi:folylpolyglutamate synthase
LAFFAVKEALNGRARLLDSLRAINEATNPGRCEMHTFPPVFENDVPDLLVDGAHNEDAATALSEYVDNYYRKQPSTREDRLRNPPVGGWPITWVMAMSEGKDPVKVLEKLLKPGDSLVLTTFGPVDGMPWVKPVEPNKILEAARKVVPDITAIVLRKRGLHQALMASRFLAGIHSRIVLTGSLYLVGDFLREKTWFSMSRTARIKMRRRWKNKVNHFLSKQADGEGSTLPDDGLSEEEDEEDIESSEEDDEAREFAKSKTQRGMKKARVPSNDRRDSRSRRSSSRKRDALDKYFPGLSDT